MFSGVRTEHGHPLPGILVCFFNAPQCIYLSATQLMHAPVHGVRNTVQQLLRKTSIFISPELWPQQARTELSLLQVIGSL